MGSSTKGGDMDPGHILADSLSYAEGSEWSTPAEQSSDMSRSYAETDTILDGETDDMKQELLGVLTRRRSLKVAKGVTRMSSLKPRRPGTRKGIGGDNRKKKSKKLRSNKHTGLESNETDALPNYLKATRSSDVKKVTSQSSLDKSDREGEGDIDGSFDLRSDRSKPVMAFRRVSSLRPVRILAKIPSLRSKKASGRKSSEKSEVVDSSGVHKATCSSAIKGSKLAAQIESPQADNVPEKIAARRVCPYSYCSLHGHRHTAPTLRRLKSARKRAKSQNDKRLDGAQASDSSWEDKHCLEPSAMRGRSHAQAVSVEAGLESGVAEKVKGKLEESPESGKVKLVSIGTQTDLELEDMLYWSPACIASDSHRETSQAIEKTDDGKLDLPSELSHGDSTPVNDQSTPSEAMLTGVVEEEAREEASVLPSGESNSPDEESAETSPEELKQDFPDTIEEPISMSNKMDERQESSQELTVSLNGSTEESILACKAVDESLESPCRSEADSIGDDSFNSSFGRRKFNRLWYLIYNHMVSDVAENGGMESPVHPDNSPVQENTPQDELKQSDAIKLLQEAVSKILEQSQDQCPTRKSRAETTASDEVEAGEELSAVKKGVKIQDMEGVKLEAPEILMLKEKREAHAEGKPKKEEKPEAPEVSVIEDAREANAGGRPSQLASKRWSNLKKYILMKRFIKAMEKTKYFRQRIQRLASSEVYPEQEKVNLRHQLIDERKNAEEWMLDRALQKVISKLDPAQKRRVSLLVEAFETVNPALGGETRTRISLPTPSNVRHSGAKETSLDNNREKTAFKKFNSTELLTGEKPLANSGCREVMKKLCGPSVDGEENRKGSESSVASRILSQVSMEKENFEMTDQVDGQASGRVQDTQRETSDAANSLLESGDDGMSRKGSVDGDISTISSASVRAELKDPSVAITTNDGDIKSMNTDEVTVYVKEDGEALAERGDIPVSSDPESRVVPVSDARDDQQPEEKKCTGLWYLIYKHMASGKATELGSESSNPAFDDNGKDDQETIEDSQSVDMDMPGFLPDSSQAEQDALTKKITDKEDVKFRKLEAVRLVMQAIDEILVDYDSSSASDQFNASDGVPEQEDEEKRGSGYGKSSLQANTDPTEDKPLLDTEVQTKPEQEAQEECQDVNKLNSRPAKNWNNLRKMILLNRFVKALEKVKDIKPRERRHLHLEPDMEPEKVNLKHQDMDGRKGSEEYLLDYALQQAVSRLTPARKRKVQLLVQAFETVTPPLRQ